MIISKRKDIKGMSLQAKPLSERRRRVDIFFAGRGMSTEQVQGLEREVREYCGTTVHSGFTRPFGFQKFDVSELNPHMLIILSRKILVEDISDIDPTYNSGLQEVGTKYGVAIRLPHWAYSK